MVPFNDDRSEDETVEDLKDVINAQNKRIDHLQSKLENYLEVVVERDGLQELCDGLDQWKDDIESHHKKIYGELKSALNLQKEKLSRVSAAERKREETIVTLQDAFDCVSEKLKTRELNENRLQFQLTECETNLERVQDELRRTKAERDERDCELETANARLRRAEEDAAERLCELDRLNGEADAMRRALAAAEDEKRDACLAAERSDGERTAALAKLNDLCRRLGESAARCEELERKLRDGERALCALTESQSALCAASERSRCDVADRIAELTAAARAKDDELDRAKDVIVELRRENKRAAAESRALSDRVRDCEIQLDRMADCGGGPPSVRPSPIDDDTVKAIMAKYLPPPPPPTLAAAAAGRDPAPPPPCLVDEMVTMKCELVNARQEVENLMS